VLNTILAPIFIFGYFGIPGYGVAGAAGVAVFGQTVGFIISFCLLKFKVTTISPSLRDFHWNGDTVKSIISVGGPTMVMLSIGAFFTSAFNAILITFSTSAVAVMGVYFRIQTFIFLPVNGLGQGALPVMAFNYGAKNRLRLMSAFTLQMKLAIGIFVVGFALFQIFPVQLLTLFNAEGEMMDIGVHALRIISIHFLIAGFVIPCVCMFQATAHASFALVISIVRQLGFLLPMAWVLAFQFGINATWFAFPIAEGGTAVLAAIFLRYVYKKDIHNIPDGAPVT
jgi:Na+-driven multidrug efflux pump